LSRWAILTGEYPPRGGGVGDYTRRIAAGLAARGDEVHVWCPGPAGAAPADDDVAVHALPDRFGPRGLAVLSAALGRLPRDTRLLVQYTPHAYGHKAMNLPFCLWLAAWRRQPVWVMFHEVAFPLRRGQPWRHRVLGGVTRLMAWLVRRAAERTFVSTPAWSDLLLRLGPGPVEWLPVPSNLPETVAPTEVAAARARLAPAGTTALLGHFGTFGEHVAALLAEILPPLVRADAGRRVVLVGRNSTEFLGRLESAHPDLAGRVVATGRVEPAEAAACLAACDLLLQPYPDGATTRRTTLMSGLALARPVVTTAGALTEPLWHDCGAVALAPADAPADFMDQAERLLRDPDRRADLAAAGATLYRDRFSVEASVHLLRSAPGSEKIHESASTAVHPVF
jgi:glycosyltransferase involved in cell wall biosynthesis